MTVYKIYKWSMIGNGNGGDPIYPVFYIKPDNDLIQKFIKNNFAMKCKINETGCPYSRDIKKFGPIIIAIKKSCDVLKTSRRPNFFEQTKLYACIIFNIRYPSFPLKNGFVEFL